MGASKFIIRANRPGEQYRPNTPNRQIPENRISKPATYASKIDFILGINVPVKGSGTFDTSFKIARIGKGKESFESISGKSADKALEGLRGKNTSHQKVDFRNIERFSDLTARVDRSSNIRVIDLVADHDVMLDTRTFSVEQVLISGALKAFQSGRNMTPESRVEALKICDNISNLFSMMDSGKLSNGTNNLSTHTIRAEKLYLSAAKLISGQSDSIYNATGSVYGKGFDKIAEQIGDLILHAANKNPVEQHPAYCGQKALESFASAKIAGNSPTLNQDTANIKSLTIDGKRIMVVKTPDMPIKDISFQKGLIFSQARPDMVISVSEKGVALDFSPTLSNKDLTSLQKSFMLLFGYVFSKNSGKIDVSGRFDSGQRLFLHGNNIDFGIICDKLSEISNQKDLSTLFKLILPRMGILNKYLKIPVRGQVFDKMLSEILHQMVLHFTSIKQGSQKRTFNMLLKDIENLRESIKNNPKDEDLITRSRVLKDGKKVDPIKRDKQGKREQGQEQKKDDIEKDEKSGEIVLRPFEVIAPKYQNPSLFPMLLKKDGKIQPLSVAQFEQELIEVVSRAISGLETSGKQVFSLKIVTDASDKISIHFEINKNFDSELLSSNCISKTIEYLLKFTGYEINFTSNEPLFIFNAFRFATSVSKNKKGPALQLIEDDYHDIGIKFNVIERAKVQKQEEQKAADIGAALTASHEPAARPAMVYVNRETLARIEQNAQALLAIIEYKGGLKGAEKGDIGEIRSAVNQLRQIAKNAHAKFLLTSTKEKIAAILNQAEMIPEFP